MPGPLRRLRAFRARWRATHAVVARMQPDVDAAREVSGLALERADHAAAVAAGAQAAVDRLGVSGEHIRDALHRLERAQARGELQARIPATTRWIEETPVPEDVLISVVLPTRDRPELLGGAIASVLAQRYGRWELLVVDDGERDVSGVVAEHADDRIRLLRGPQRGVAAARNVALREARGDLVAYLDDDNRMEPLWLAAVAWAFAQRTDADVLYGARLVEDSTGIGRQPDDLFALVQLEPFHRRRLEEGNFIDLGVLVHRAGLPEARFDEDLVSLSDWDLVLRLTRTKPPALLPVIACAYGTSAPDRLQEHPRHHPDHLAVRTKVLASRPLRVLCFNAMYPMMTESYVIDEMEALAQNGADVAFARILRPPTDVPIRRPLYESLEPALQEVQPDLLLTYWLTWTGEAMERIEASGLPFAVRVHSFDFDPDVARRVLAHPMCIGIWAYPHHTAAVPEAHVLPALFAFADQIPVAEERDVVMSMSAGLPKKDWDLLVDAFCRMPARERLILIGRAREHEGLPARVAEQAERCADPPRVRIDVPRREILQTLGRTAAVVYTLEPGVTQFGNPMALVEGLCAGSSVIVPDRPEALRFAGPHARPYTTAEDIVGHVKEIVSGGPAMEQEWAENRAYGLRSFADPALGRRFHAELIEALETWRRTRALNRPS